MSRKKVTTNTPAWTPPPATAATNQLGALAQENVDYSTPIRASFAQAEQASERQYKNPLGGYTTADVRDKSIREERDTRGQNRGIALANAAQQSSADKFNRTASWANATAPQMYNAQQVNRQPFSWQDGLGMAGGVASGGSK